jgi:hypothetical protein
MTILVKAKRKRKTYTDKQLDKLQTLEQKRLRLQIDKSKRKGKITKVRDPFALPVTLTKYDLLLRVKGSQQAFDLLWERGDTDYSIKEADAHDDAYETIIKLIKKVYK